MKYDEVDLINRLNDLGYENWVNEIDKYGLIYEVTYHFNNSVDDEEISDGDFICYVHYAMFELGI